MCSKVDGAECVVVPISIPVASEAEIVAAFEKTLESVKGRTIRLAVVSGLSAMLQSLKDTLRWSISLRNLRLCSPLSRFCNCSLYAAVLL